MKQPKIDISKLLKQLEQFGQDGKRLAVAVTNTTAENIANQARIRAPVGQQLLGKKFGNQSLGSNLRQSIGFTEVTSKNNYATVFANAPYAPYINWGTGGKVSVEAIFKDMAAQFKGRGIKKVDIPATGFLTSPYITESQLYPKRLTSAIEKLTKQYNAKK